MQISIICANDSMELAFLPDTTAEEIEAHRVRIKKVMDDRYGRNIYVHIHVVELYESKKEEPNETTTSETK